mmetsp:Transcript_9721/g.58988  ORF Transcript_9721/g.58988 Transcript_9721/m.58988 type:complete len:222 (-) Transcript_9721:413-1078(-)
MSPGSIFTMTSSTSGMMATVAVDVWTLPWDSVAGTRWTRCTPASYFSLLYTLSPEICSTHSLYPPDSAMELLTYSTFHPCVCAYLVNIRTKSPAQIPASSPPVPARISSMIFFSSRGSLGSSISLSLSSSSASSASSTSNSSSAMALNSGSDADSFSMDFASFISEDTFLYLSYISTTSVSSATVLLRRWYSVGFPATSGSANRRESSLYVLSAESSFSTM